MMETSDARLKARVAAINKANSYARQLYLVLREKLEPLVGQKLEKVDGELLAKVEKLLPNFQDTLALSVYRHRSNYSLAWVVKTCEPIPPHTCTYHETFVYVGNMKNGVLTGLCDPTNYHSDFTVEEIVEKRRVLAEAKAAVWAAEGELYPFGEFDR